MNNKAGNRPNRTDVDRLPPYAGEVEAAALAAVLLDPIAGMNECEERGVGTDWFYDLRYQMIWGAMAALQKAGQAVEGVMVSQWLTEHQPAPADSTWTTILIGLPETGMAAQLGSYLDVLEGKRLERALVRAGTEMVSGVYSVEDGEKTDARALLARIERDILRLGEEATAERESHIKAIIEKVIGDMENYHRGHAQIRGVVTTGLDYLDKLTLGLGGRNGNYVVISARPGIGKTSLATQIATHAALDFVWWEPVLEKSVVDGRELLKPVIETLEDGKERIKCERKVGVPVGVFSLEMADAALVERMMFQRAGGDMQRWRTGFATNADLKPMVVATGKLSKGAIYIDDTGRCTIESLKAKARRMQRQYGIKLFVIDYIQLMKAGGKRFRDDRVQELSEISAELQALGKELKVPLLVLAQMNRDFEKDPTRRPRLSDLKDCGSIEQDADLVMFLYKPKLRDKEMETYNEAMEAVYGKNKADWSQRPRRINGLVAKNRYGPDGVCELLFQKSCTRFLDWVGWLKDNKQRDLAAGERESRGGDSELPMDEA